MAALVARGSQPIHAIRHSPDESIFSHSPLDASMIFKSVAVLDNMHLHLYEIVALQAADETS